MRATRGSHLRVAAKQLHSVQKIPVTGAVWGATGRRRAVYLRQSRQLPADAQHTVAAARAIVNRKARLKPVILRQNKRNIMPERSRRVDHGTGAARCIGGWCGERLSSAMIRRTAQAKKRSKGRARPPYAALDETLTAYMSVSWGSWVPSVLSHHDRSSHAVMKPRHIDRLGPCCDSLADLGATLGTMTATRRTPVPTPDGPDPPAVRLWLLPLPASSS